MTYGILTNETCKEVFKQINQRKFCEECQVERSPFTKKDRKGKPSYSNLLPGFSSSTITIPIDVLIVAEAHGGGRPEDFRQQKELDYEISWLAAYYMRDSLTKFHQQQMRKLLQYLDAADKSWVFTDLIKCFVWHGYDKENDLKGRENWKIATRRCRKYLRQQIELLQPHKILGLGGTVATDFGVVKPEHGSIHSIRINSYQCLYLHSLFPSQWTADQWVAKNGWEPVYRAIGQGEDQ